MKFKIGKGSKAKKSSIALGADAKNTDGKNPGGQNGSKEEAFFEARPWLDSDSEDDFHSVKGDFTPSRGSTPNHQITTPKPSHLSKTLLSEQTPADKSEHSLTGKKKNLLELLQEKRDDDEHDGVANVRKRMENHSVHAGRHPKSSEAVLKQFRTNSGHQKHKKERSSRVKMGCVASSIWKFSFKNCRKKKKNSTAQ